MKKQLLLIAIPVFFLSCKEGWTDEYRSEYMRTCIEEARRTTFTDSAQAAAYCQCSLESIMTHYQTVEELLINRDSIAIRNEFQACHDKVLGR